jgi:hypothetical protein
MNMRKLLLACLLAFPLAAIPSQAWAWDGSSSKEECEGDGGGHGCLKGGHFAGLHGHFAGLHGHFAALHGHFAGLHGLGLFSGDHQHAPNVPQAGPWYLYWPYQAHFQTPAPMPFPYYSPTLTLPPNFQGGVQPYQPVGYAQPAPAGQWNGH